jgi:hypothetical protein
MGSQTGSSLPAKFPTKRKEHHRRSTKQSPGYYYQLVALEEQNQWLLARMLFKNLIGPNSHSPPQVRP